MRSEFLLLGLSFLGLSLAACADNSAAAQQTAAQKTDVQQTVTPPANSVVVAELFTSQGCSSCPPAERLFSELADRDDLLTMEWHVDYWDQLVHGGSKWKDRYSSDAFTSRQRSYNRAIRGTGGVYTPQAIVNGQLEDVGSRPSAVSHMLDRAPALSVPVQIDGRSVRVGPSDSGADILFVRLLKEHTTDVKGGENKGRKLAGKHIVLDAKILGQTGGDAKQLNLPSVGSGETCAVLVQTLGGKVGPVLGAAKCA